ARVGGVVAHVIEGIAVETVAARLGSEADHTHGAAIFGLHAGAFHVELSYSVHRHRTDGGAFILIGNSAAGQRRAVHLHVPSAALAAANAECARVLGFRGDDGKVKDVANLPGYD